MLPGSEPAPGSVSPKQPTSSPLARLGRYFRRCSSDPYAWSSEEHTPELQSIMRNSYAVFRLKKKQKPKTSAVNVMYNTLRKRPADRTTTSTQESDLR